MSACVRACVRACVFACLRVIAIRTTFVLEMIDTVQNDVVDVQRLKIQWKIARVDPFTYARVTDTSGQAKHKLNRSKWSYQIYIKQL